LFFNFTEEVVLTKRNQVPEHEGRRPRPSLSELFPGLAARFSSTPTAGTGEDAKGNRNLNRESSMRVKAASQGKEVSGYLPKSEIIT